MLVLRWLRKSYLFEKVYATMFEDPFIQQLIDDFLDAIHLRQLAHCQALLAMLQEQAATNDKVAPWCDYLSGILTFEIDQDWAAAERIFTTLSRQPSPALPQGRVLYALGCTLEMQGRWQEAIQVYKEALTLPQTADDIAECVKLWKEIATCYCEEYMQGDGNHSSLRRGEEFCQQALAALEAITDTSPRLMWLQGSIWNTLGAIYRYSGQWAQAAICYRHDLAICETLDDRHGMGISYLNLGEVYHHRNGADATDEDWSQAMGFYQEALALLRQYKNSHLEADVLQNLGSLQQAMGNPQAALDFYQAAVAVIEDLRTRISAAEARSGFFATVIGTYSKLVPLLIATGDIAAAFDMVERARSRSFLEILGNQPLRAPQAPQALLHSEAQLRAELHELYHKPESDSATIRAKEVALDATLQQIRLYAAEYVDLRTMHPLTTTQVQARLPSDSVLLSYFMADNAIYAFAATTEMLTVRQLSIEPLLLQRAFDHEGNLLRLRPDSNQQLHEPWLLQRLHQLLIEPMLPMLRGRRRLCIIPHGQLHFVPFQALFNTTTDGNSAALIDHYHIVYAPSATVLLDYCQQERELADGSLLAMGYNSDLRHAEAECAAITKLVRDSKLLTAHEATGIALRQSAATFRWVHIACHGSFNRHAPLMSYLRLADAPLYASDVLQQLRLHADLVTLAACETGRNQVLKGDELLGLVRAFLYAGTAAVVVTLWPVDELSTRIFMECFYRELMAGEAKATALRTAQLYLRALTTSKIIEILAQYGEDDPIAKVNAFNRMTAPAERQASQDKCLFAHPYFWAPFILVGDRLET